MSSQGIILKVAMPYAEALLEAVRNDNSMETTAQDLSLIKQLLTESAELQLFLDNPLVTSIAKKNVLNSLLVGQVSPLVLKFLLVLIDRRRITLLSTIIQKYLELAYKVDSVTVAQVRTSIVLTDEQQVKLMHKIKDITRSKEVKLVITIDQSLIGGFIVKIGSKVIDTSLAGKLKNISFYLQKATS